MNNIELTISQISNKDDFLNFMNWLIRDYRNGSWGNSSLEKYLGGIESWVDDMEGYFININDQKTIDMIRENKIDWKLFAQILVAASMYE